MGLAAFAVLAAVHALAVHSHGEGVERAARTEAVRVASVSAGSLAHVATDHPSVLARRLRAMRRANPRLAGVAVHRSSARPSAPLALAGAPPSGRLAAVRRARALESGRVIVRSERRAGRRLVLVAAALPRRGASARGVLSLALRVPPARATSPWLLAAGGAGALLLGGLTALLVALRVSRPLGALAEHASRAVGDRRPPALAWRRGDEIGALASAIDDMAATLGRLEGLAMIDPLTGLANQRAMAERLRGEFGRARREVYRVAVAVLDIDHFKGMNDSFGHAVGDDALRLLAATLVEQLRPGDLCGRNGGDEFVLALPRADVEEAGGVIDRIRRALAAQELGSTGERLTISAGVSEFPLHGWGQEELLEHADRALYVSKAEGRDRCTAHRGHEGSAPGGLPAGDVARHQATIRSLRALVQAVDAKDGYTFGHSQRVAWHAGRLARALGLEAERVEMVRAAGLLHDVGRIGVDSALLAKIAPLSEHELRVLRRHSELGREIVAAAGLAGPAAWIAHLHERWDGLGHPAGLSGASIPLESRILHLAEALDSMTHPPRHREARQPERALMELELGAGGRFDPELALLMAELVREGSVEPGPGAAVPDAFRDLALPPIPRPTLPALLPPPRA